MIGNNAGSVFEGNNVTVGVASQRALSFLKLYYDKTKDRVYPYLTAVFDVKEGVIRGVTWDDACGFCGGFGDACEENTYDYNGVPQDQDTSGQHTRSCFVEKAECDRLRVEDPENILCDLTVYTVWSGTDFNGKALQSQAYRFSEFPVQDISDGLTRAVSNVGIGQG